MDSSSTAQDFLSAYPAFFYSKLFQRFFPGDLLRHNALVTLISAIALAVASAFDRSLYLSGSSVGLIEHPAVYAFLLAQWIFPYSVTAALQKFLDIDKKEGSPLSRDFLDSEFRKAVSWLEQSLLRKTNFSRALYDLAVAAGVVALIWNTYQNQRPETLGFDFWDSVHFPLGFAVSRLYKLYLWGLFLPALFHAQVFVFIALSRALSAAAKTPGLTLEPFNPDQCGGVRSLIDPAIVPMLPPLLISSLLALCALSVHKRFDVTPIIGISIVAVVFMSLFLIPALSLRKAILAEKKRKLEEIAGKQNLLFLRIVSGEERSDSSIKAAHETIDALQSMATRVRCLPNWPQIAIAIRAVSIATASPIITWCAAKGGDRLISLILS